MDICDLGKPTKRGIKICKNCKNKNGVRSYFCKHCNIQLKPKTLKSKKAKKAKVVPIIIDYDLFDMRNNFTDELDSIEKPILNIQQSFIESLLPGSNPKNDPALVQVNEENLKYWEWLENLTERINQHLEIKLCGDKVEIKDYIPSSYFNLLLKRISSTKSVDKLCLPNITETNERTTDPPLGSYVMYTWTIGNIEHLQKIFSINQTPILDKKILSKLIPQQFVAKFKRFKNILPSNISVRLKLRNEKQEPLFMIMWTPKLSNKTNYGELKLQYQYDHFINDDLTTFENAMKLFNSSFKL